MIYISGPITSVPNYMEHFNKAEETLLSIGKDVFNPARNILLFKNIHPEYDWYIDLSLTELSWCNEILMLKGWENSKGARLEYEYAKAHNYNILFEGEDTGEECLKKCNPIINIPNPSS